jgi:CubicO group peptidase (beta-lactamase class C family)
MITRRHTCRLTTGTLAILLQAALLWVGWTAEARAARSCDPPAQGVEWTRAAPSEVDLDEQALRDALEFAAPDGSAAAAVYRYGCLAGTDRHAPSSRGRHYESWSMAKSVVSLAAGRAMTLGLLSPNDRVGGLVPEADRAHGAVTVRQLLEMTSGLHWNFFRDYSRHLTMNRVDDALTLPFDHDPGTHFEYAQSAVALAAEVVARAARTDFQTFLQRELFGPIGIARDSWSWTRDQHGNTLGFMGLQLRPSDYARLGHLMLERGVWRGRRLLADAYVTFATASTSNNPGYGWFWWVNSGTRFIGPTLSSRPELAGSFVEAAPPDMYSAVGFGDQLIMVFPSLDLVLTRSTAESRPDARQQGDPTGRPEFKHELARRVLRAVTDRKLPDPGPFQPRQSLAVPDVNHGISHSATERRHLAAARTTPPRPPAGPAVPRAVLIGGKALRTAPVDVSVDRHGDVRVAVACPPAGRRACEGSATLTRSGSRVSKRVEYRAARGRRSTVRIALGANARDRLARRGRLEATIKVTSVAEAGPITTRAAVVLRRSRSAAGGA